MSLLANLALALVALFLTSSLSDDDVLYAVIVWLVWLCWGRLVQGLWSIWRLGNQPLGGPYGPPQVCIDRPRMVIARKPMLSQRDKAKVKKLKSCALTPLF